MLAAYALAAALLSAEPASPAASLVASKVDFSGTWKLDLAASDPLDDLLAAQGASWIERKAAGSFVVTQKVSNKPEGLEVCVESSLGTKCNLVKAGQGWEEKETEKGKVRGRADWSEDGKALVVTTELTLKDKKPAQMIVTRSLEDEGKTTVQTLELKIKDGKAYKARRILRRQGK
ncbi:MAG TPA: hypothetical protein VGK67_21345 [Myxococcales bacterium]|jgi:hypothetical protein